MKILVAEDDEILLQFLSQTLARWGHEVVAAVDGQDAWNNFERHADIAMVISDWMMPRLDGVELVRRIRGCGRPGYVYIIMLTARSRTEDVVEGIETGADDFLVKPFQRDELQVRVRAGQRIVELEQNLERHNLGLQAANDRMRRDLEAAARVQRSLLPSDLPVSQHVKFAWSFRPCAELSGDGLGIMPLDDNHVAMYMLDVSGQGVAAALLSVSVHHAMSPVFAKSSILRQPVPGSSAWRITPPAEVAAELNRRFPMDDDIGRHFTMLYGLLHENERQFRFVSAGHPGPLHVLGSGEARLLPTSGRPIGFDESTQYKEQLLQLAPGDRLYLYSDGVWKQMFGPCQLLSTLKEIRGLPLHEGLDLVLERALRWSGTPDFNDDASLLGIEIAVQDDAAGRSPEATR